MEQVADNRSGLRDQVGYFKELSKSGIITLVLISVLGGYLAGHSPEKPLDWGRMALTLLGLMLVSSGSTALNQFQERSIDAAMPRTAGRPLPSGKLSPQQALVFIALALALGTLVLGWISPILALLGWVAVISYNGLYTLWWKQHWAYAAVPGAIPGALPILMGYEAARGSLAAPGGWYLFFLLFFWQMPHFWVVAIKYKQDYAAGKIPTLPVTYGTEVTVRQIAVWCLAYIAISLAGPLFLPLGWGYSAATILMGAKLLWELRKFAKAPESRSWLHFFLWVNFSLIIYIFTAVADLWIHPLFPKWIAGI